MAKKNSKKTNAVRIIEKNKISYEAYSYDPNIIDDSIEAAKMIGKDPDRVFKTLVTSSNSKEYYVFVIPVTRTLDLKKAAKSVGEKKIEMIPQKNLLSVTGYIHKGCSPIGMKKQFFTTIDKSSIDEETIVFNGGQRGLQIELSVSKLKELLNANVCDVVTNN